MKKMNDSELLKYFIKLMETGLNEDNRELKEALNEIFERLKSTKYEVKEKGIIVGKPVNILLFTNEELIIILKCLQIGLVSNELEAEGIKYEAIQKAFEKVSHIQKVVAEIN